VPWESAVLPGFPDAEPVVIHADHIKMVKFHSRNDPDYKKVARLLVTMTERAPGAIQARWEEEAGEARRHVGMLT
jgi:hypothetical protein